MLENLAVFEKWLYEEFYPAAVAKENMFPVVATRVSLNVREIYERHWPIVERPRKYYTEPVIDKQMKVAMEKGVKLEDHWRQVGPYWLKRMTTEHPGFCWTAEDFYGADLINDELYHDLNPRKLRKLDSQLLQRIRRKKQQQESEQLESE